jgi:hypothetical protein
LRYECLNASWFGNLFDARRQIESWRGHYNTNRPHSSLGYRTPEQSALSRAAGPCSAGVGQGLKRRPLAPRPHPRSNRGANRRELSYAQMNGFGRKVIHNLPSDPFATELRNGVRRTCHCTV